MKIRVAAPPEGGKANKAIAKLLAKELGVRSSDISLVSGQTHPEKVFEVSGMNRSGFIEQLGESCVKSIIYEDR